MKLVKLIAACSLIFASAAVSAQAWPDNKLVRLVVAYPAGAGVDPVARLIGKQLAERWNTAVIIENKAGGSGTIGAAHVAKSAPDGLTILVSATPEVVINQHVMKKMAYDPEKDLQPVTLAVRLPFALAANPARPYSNVAELIAYARKNPGKVSYASSGAGTLQHLSGVLFESLTGIEMLHVPYKGVAPAIQDLLAGHVDIGFGGLHAFLPYVKAGTLTGLGVTSKTASPAAPNLQPLAATPGLNRFDLNQWFGVFVPRGTPAAIVNKIQKDVAAVLAIPELKDALEKQGAQPSGMPTAEFEVFVKQESKKFAEIVKKANITE